MWSGGSASLEHHVVRKRQRQELILCHVHNLIGLSLGHSLPCLSDFYRDSVCRHHTHPSHDTRVPWLIAQLVHRGVSLWKFSPMNRNDD
jgi:hypothetical protein